MIIQIRGDIMSNFKPIPIEIEDFKEIIDKDYYCVDKTLIIKDILFVYPSEKIRKNA